MSPTFKKEKKKKRRIAMYAESLPLCENKMCILYVLWPQNWINIEIKNGRFW